MTLLSENTIFYKAVKFQRIGRRKKPILLPCFSGDKTQDKNYFTSFIRLVEHMVYSHKRCDSFLRKIDEKDDGK